MPKVLLLTALVSGAWVASAFGQATADTPALRLTLEDAQARAMEASHRLAEARAHEAAAQAVVLARGAADRPMLSATAGYTRTNHVVEFVVPSATGGATTQAQTAANPASQED